MVLVAPVVENVVLMNLAFVLTRILLFVVDAVSDWWAQVWFKVVEEWAVKILLVAVVPSSKYQEQSAGVALNPQLSSLVNS